MGPRPSKPITIQRHVHEQEHLHEGATGKFTGLLLDLIFAAKVISREVNKAGLADILGQTDATNVSGDDVKRLDVFAHRRIVQAMDHGGHLCVMASEEEEGIIPIPDHHPRGDYVLLMDPLDGSSNIDFNVSIGTIFSIYRRRGPAARGEPGTIADCLQAGRDQVAAGYILYGSSTMLVLTTGGGVNGFTLDPSVGEFLLSHPDIRTPESGSIYSANEVNYPKWDAATRRYSDRIKKEGKKTLRYIGSLVADFHRNLLKGGIFLYPADCSAAGVPKPKLRLLYEANPLAMIIDQAGGKCTTGTRRILDIVPTELHQKVPLVIGSPRDVEDYEAEVAAG